MHTYSCVCGEAEEFLRRKPPLFALDSQHTFPPVHNQCLCFLFVYIKTGAYLLSMDPPFSPLPRNSSLLFWETMYESVGKLELDKYLYLHIIVQRVINLEEIGLLLAMQAWTYEGIGVGWLEETLLPRGKSRMPAKKWQEQQAEASMVK